MKLFICKHCGKEFKGHKVRVYCSFDCKKADLDASTTTRCPICGKEFTYYKSWPRVYCSRACSAPGGAAKRINKVIVACDYCGAEKETIPARANAYKSHYCSNDCRNKGQRKEKVIKVPVPRVLKRVPCTCKVCGKYFERAPSQVRQGVDLPLLA